MDDVYDLVVIGAGPAGQVAAELAASFGRRVLIVERNKPGGVVTTTGGAPTKALREAALYLTGFRQEEVYGIRAAAPLDVVLPTIRTRVERVRDVLQGVVATRLAARGIAYLQGTARLGADHTVRVTSPDGVEHELAPRAVLVATGSRPTHYPGIPFDDPDVYDSDQIYSIKTVPKDIVIVGGGPVGIHCFGNIASGHSLRSGGPRRPPRRWQRGGIPHTGAEHTDLQLRLPRRDGRRADSAGRADGPG